LAKWHFDWQNLGLIIYGSLICLFYVSFLLENSYHACFCFLFRSFDKSNCRCFCGTILRKQKVLPRPRPGELLEVLRVADEAILRETKSIEEEFEKERNEMDSDEREMKKQRHDEEKVHDEMVAKLLVKEFMERNSDPWQTLSESRGSETESASEPRRSV